MNESMTLLEAGARAARASDVDVDVNCLSKGKPAG
jgi:hypothetical protein